MDLKRCCTCLNHQPPDQFYKQSNGRFGVGARCRSCSRTYMRAYQRKKAGIPIDAPLPTPMTPEEKLLRNRELSREWHENNKKKNLVHSKVSRAIQAGKLIRPSQCEADECQDSDVQAHHDDYDQPLNVRWLCQQHHSRWHRDNGPGLNGED